MNSAVRRKKVNEFTRISTLVIALVWILLFGSLRTSNRSLPAYEAVFILHYMRRAPGKGQFSGSSRLAERWAQQETWVGNGTNHKT